MTDEQDSDEDTIKAFEIDPDEVTLPKEEVMDELAEMRSSLSDISVVTDDRMGALEKSFEELNQEVSEINNTLESNEKHIHFLPPGTDLNSPLVSLELTLAVFALGLAGAQLVQGNPVSPLAIAIGLALLVPPILTYRN